jgi:hypothetical protein
MYLDLNCRIDVFAASSNSSTALFSQDTTNSMKQIYSSVQSFLKLYLEIQLEISPTLESLKIT